MRNFNQAHRKIETFIGAWGVKTGDIADGDHLLKLASRLFEIDNNGVESDMAAKIDALGRKERKRLAGKNLQNVFGSQPHQGTTVTESSGVSRTQLERMMANSRPQLVDGAGQDCVGELDIDPAQLLRKVVSAVISAGQGHVLYEFPELLEFMGARIPSRDELAGHTNVDERMFEAKAKWSNGRTL